MQSHVSAFPAAVLCSLLPARSPAHTPPQPRQVCEGELRQNDVATEGLLGVIYS